MDDVWSRLSAAGAASTIARSDESAGEQPALTRGVHRLGARGRVELAEEVARVGLGRRLADGEAPRDLLEAQALLEARQQLALAPGQRDRVGPRRSDPEQGRELRAQPLELAGEVAHGPVRRRGRERQ